MAREKPLLIGVGAGVLSMTTTVVLARPTLTEGTYQVGDVIALAVRDQASSGGTAPYFTCPNTVNVTPSYTVGSEFRAAGLLVYVVTDPDAIPSTFTVTTSLAAGSRYIGKPFALRRVDLASMLSGQSVYAGTNITNGRRQVSFTTATDPYLHLFFGSTECGATVNHVPSTLPSGFTEIGNVTSSSDTGTGRTYLWLGYKDVTDGSTASAAADIAWSGAPSGPNALGFAFRGAEPAPTEMSGTVALGLKLSADVRVNRPAVNVTSVLRTPGFTMAHRGNGNGGIYAEFSEWAFRQAANRGYPVLEFSANRTSDGVWFGMHDQYLDRTSGVTGSVDPTTMTWATLSSTYQITNAADGVVRPYYRLDEFIATYKDTHVLMLDPKWRHSSHRTEFLDICQAVGPDRCIVKFLWDTPTLATAAAARGLKSWGFAYEADVANEAFPAAAAAWTLLGMDLGASSGAWTSILGYGKPVIGHIAESQAQYATAISRGAVGVQVGASQTVTAVGPTGEAHARTGAATFTITPAASVAGGTPTVTAPTGLQITATGTAIASGGSVSRTGTASLTLTATALADIAGGTITRTGVAGLNLTATASAAVALIRTGTATITLIATAVRTGEHRDITVLSVTVHPQRTVTTTETQRAVTIEEHR